MSTTLWQSFLLLFRSPREPYVPSPEPFLKLDVDALRTQFKPADWGAALGADNLPPTDSTFPDSRENEITRFCQDELDRSHVAITKGIDTHLASIRQLSGTSGEAEIDQLRDVALSQLRSRAQDARNRRDATLQDATEATEDFRRFRERHRRTTLPDTTRGGLLPISIFVVMMAIESALNGNQFAQGNDFGLLGGVFQAATFSFLNIMLGAATGHFVLRQLFHVSVARRVAGGIGLMFAAAVAVALNLVIAHFRDAMVSGIPQADAAAKALATWLAAPFSLADLLSWILSLVGFLFFWIACYDAFKMSDPYPSYSARYRRLLDAKAAYTEAVTETHSALSTIRDEFTRRIADVARQRDIYAHHLTSLYDRIARLSSSYHRHCDSVGAIHRLLVEEYRNANRLSRTTAAPSHFAIIAGLSYKPIPSYTTPTTVTDLSASAAVGVRAITDVHDEELRALLPVAQLGLDSRSNALA